MSDRTAARALVIAIDGPAGAGKSTVAKRVARHYGVPYLDTGAIYRTLALSAREQGVSWDDGEGLASLARGLPIRFDGDPQRVYLDGRDVSDRIRTPDISEGASQVSAHAAVRAALLELQRALGAKGCIAEGRDMGTVVFPETPHKFFLTANLAARASRRHADLVAAEAGGAAPSLTDVTEDMQKRDTRDSTRDAAPLSRAPDAVLMDSSDLDADAVVARIIEAVEARETAG